MLMMNTSSAPIAVPARNTTMARTAMRGSAEVIGLLLALAVMVLLADGDGPVFDRAEGPGGDIVPAACLAGADVESRGDGVDFGAHSRAVAIWREREHVRITGGWHCGVGLQ